MEEPDVDTWRRAVREWYPNLLEQTYFVPPVFMNRIPHAWNDHDAVTIHDTGDIQPSTGNHADRGLPDAQPDVRDDKTHLHVLGRLQDLAKEQKEVMFVCSQLQFKHCLNETCCTATEDCTFYQRSGGKRDGDSGTRRGDFDLLLINKKYGIFVAEVKSVGGASSPQCDRQQDESVVVEVRNAVKQLNQKESAMKRVLSHWSPEVRKTIMLPNVTSTELRQVLSSHPELEKELRECLDIDSTVDPVELCVCRENVSGKDATWEFSQWWNKRVAGPRISLRDDVYEDTVARVLCSASTCALTNESTLCIAKSFERMMVDVKNGLVSAVRENRLMIITGPSGSRTVALKLVSRLHLLGLLKDNHAAVLQSVGPRSPRDGDMHVFEFDRDFERFVMVAWKSLTVTQSSDLYISVLGYCEDADMSSEISESITVVIRALAHLFELVNTPRPCPPAVLSSSDGEAWRFLSTTEECPREKSSGMQNQASVEMEDVVKKSADRQELLPKCVSDSDLQTIAKAENSFDRYCPLGMLLADVESKDAHLFPHTHPLSWHPASSLLMFLLGKLGIKSHGSQRKPETDGSILNNTDHGTAKLLALLTDLLETQEQSFDDHQIKAWKIFLHILFADRQETEMGLLPTNKCKEEPDSTEIIHEKCIEDESGEDVIDLNQSHTDAAPEKTPEQDQCSSENSTAEDEHGKSFTCCTNPDLHTQCTEDVLHDDYNDTDKAETTDGAHTTDGMNVKLDFCCSNGIYCQETNRILADSILATEDNTRHDTAKQMIAQEEETYLVEKNASHGSAGPAVSQDSNHSDGLTTSVPAAQQVSDQADPSGDGNDNKHSSPNQDTTKAVSTIPVPNLAEEEEKEETTVLIKYEIEEKQISQKKNKKEDQGKLKTDRDGEISRALGEYYSVQNIEPQLRQQFVFMMRAETRLVHNGVENEMRRLATFHNFCPPEGVYIIPLANAGFFLPANNSVNSADQRSVLQTLLECAFCGVAVAVMKFMGRRPMDVHKEVSPGCPFVLGRENRNVSVAQMAQTSGAQFLDTVTVTSNGVSSPHGEGETPGGQAVLATDGDSATVPTAAVLALPGPGKGNAAEKPAFPLTDTVSVPPQSVTVGHAAVHASGHGRPKPGPQQLPQAGNRLGDTVSDARGIASSLPPSTLQTPPQPRQTATVTQAPSATQTAARAQESSAAPENGEGSRNSTQPSSSPTADTENSAQTGNGQGEGTQERQVVTYEQLGIFAQRPKRQDMAVAATRINTFEAWPHADSHPASEMAEAGFYYTGHADLVRCFYCKGGLKTWERSDRPWVEHSRWFPRCPFVRLCKGQKFVDAIQKLNEAGGRPTISEADVKREMLRQEEEERRTRPTTLPPPPPAAPEIQTDSAAGAVGGSTSLRSGFAAGEGNDTEAMARRLEEENQEMKETTLCKMCQTREVNVLFLPCGHLVACAYCAPALRTCAMCRQPVKGTVRVQLDEEETVDV